MRLAKQAGWIALGFVAGAAAMVGLDAAHLGPTDLAHRERFPAPSPVDVPIRVVPSEQTAGLLVIVRESTLDRDLRYYYSVRVDIENRSPAEVGNLELRLDAMDAAGHVVGSTPMAADPLRARPGDTLHAQGSVIDRDNIAQGQLHFTARRDAAAPASYVSDRVVVLTWVRPPPSHFALQATQRAFAAHGSDTDVVVAYRNVGDAPIHGFSMQLAAFDADGRQVGTANPATASFLPYSLLPGQTLVDRRSFAGVPGGAVGVGATVLEIH